MPKYYTNLQLQHMSFNQLGALLSSGEVTEKRLRSAYNDLRSKAVRKNRRIQNDPEFSKVAENEVFMKSKSLPTQSALLHEFADMNRYLNSKRSTLGGQRSIKQNYIETAQEHGMDINDENYADWIDFIKWFKESEYAANYDSEAEEVMQAFQEGSSVEDWKTIFEYFLKKKENAEKRKK